MRTLSAAQREKSERERAAPDGPPVGGCCGYLLRPESIEFWYGSPDRLRYEKVGGTNGFSRDGCLWRTL
ncbi:pyridoxine 5'-phosphate oxidase C-terminal domain-containing protein [Streptomyces sp. NPDC001698]|uniref:pyridoxine 5'-phosphate oxidase C-terminal domain-containing protein n=1 Tax=unclassified Streptomyces TaxID=2593676 RepID=UPI003688B267